MAEMQEQQTEIEIGGTLQQRIASCLAVMDKFLRQDEVIVSSMVVAEKRSSGVADNVVDCVANIMGEYSKKKIILLNNVKCSSYLFHPLCYKPELHNSF